MAQIIDENFEEYSSLGNCLVIGGSGFLGQNLIYLLHKKKVQTINLDQKQPVGEIFPSDINTIQGDFCDSKIISKVLDEGIKTVFHLASVVDIRIYPKIDLQKVNVDSLEQLISICKQKGVQNFIYTSTIDVLLSSKHNFKLQETEIPDFIKSNGMYQTTKIKAEKIVQKSFEKNVFKTVSLRLAHLIGPYDRVAFQTSKYPIKLGRSNPQMSMLDTLNASSYIINAAKNIYSCQGQIFYLSDFDQNIQELYCELTFSKQYFAIPEIFI